MTVFVNGRPLDIKRVSISYRTATMLTVCGRNPKITWSNKAGVNGELQDNDILALSEGLSIVITELPKEALGV